jgi:hypothetical protein
VLEVVISRKIGQFIHTAVGTSNHI